MAKAQRVSTIVLGDSNAIQNALDVARKLAETDLPILLVGATGTGKELFAEEIHRWSRRQGPLVDVNCGALPRDMVEAVLFGHRRGAFTGAHEDVRGLVEAADGGSLAPKSSARCATQAPAIPRNRRDTSNRRNGETLRTGSAYRGSPR